MKTRLCIVGMLALFAAWPAAAQEGGFAFLRNGINAEAGAMGDTQVSWSRDAFSTFWNPAGLAAAERNTASLSYYAWVLGTGSYAAASRLGVGEDAAVGLFVTAMESGDLEARSQPGEPEGFFSVQFVSSGASYGRRFGPFRAGVTAKYLLERIYTNSSRGYAFDFGVQADLPVRGAQFGAALQNIGKMSRLASEATQLPRVLRMGVSVHPFHLRLQEDDATLAQLFVTLEVSRFFEMERTKLHVGLGAEVFEMVTLRGGYITNDDLRGPSFGIGLELDKALVDYAYVAFESGYQGPGHIMTLTYQW